MPLISVTDAGTVLPSKPGRKQLHIHNEGPDPLRYGWEPVVTNNGTAGTDGFLMPVGVPMAMAGRELDIEGALKLITATGETATVSYTERA